MAIIYLRHPQHGEKVAISLLEAQGDIALGWIEYDPLEPAARQDELAASPEPNQLKRRRRTVTAEA